MPATKPAVYIEAAALEISWRDEKRNLSELIFDTVRRAIDDGGRGMDGIASVVLAAHDLVDGRSLSSMVTAPAAGAYLRDEIRYGDDGAAAFAAAVVRIEAGEAERSIVAAWGRASEHDVEGVSRVLFDPFLTVPLGLQEMHVSGMRAQSWIQLGGSCANRAAAVARRLDAARSNPRALHSVVRSGRPCYPLLADDMPAWADVVAAVIISSRPARVKVSGMGQSSEAFSIGDRQLARMPGLAQAARQALDEAKHSAKDLDVVEVDGLTLFDEAIALEAAGVADQGKGLDTLAGDRRVNASGGAAAGYCAPAMGLARIVEATLQLQCRAGGNQLPVARSALATGSSIVAAQTHTAIVLERT